VAKQAILPACSGVAREASAGGLCLKLVAVMGVFEQKMQYLSEVEMDDYRRPARPF